MMEIEAVVARARCGGFVYPVRRQNGGGENVDAVRVAADVILVSTGAAVGKCEDAELRLRY